MTVELNNDEMKAIASGLGLVAKLAIADSNLEDKQGILDICNSVRAKIDVTFGDGTKFVPTIFTLD